MYLPNHFAETDVARMHELVRAHSFATLVSVLDAATFATPVPLLVDAERGPRGTLVGRVAHANLHARTLDANAPSLAIFRGPHAYVSSRWCASAPNVPAWNPVAEFVRGSVAFDLPVGRLDAKRKLSQNEPPADRAGLAAALRAQGDPDAVAIVAAMEARA